ncbi:hypothetical protein [Paenibacillus glucanolyticus]|uniref:hypothetical protein n=1 Tax=Paenibacillus glucanolyticus TaxID=59843 RepID=UPI00128E6730|nr:hypothetical protein [Paenibacillus glucanolyticus]MPY19077.1 hypothetical protein [Paenibacillus glucanolyticus]
MKLNAILDSLDIPFTFQKRPVAIPADLRVDWRIGTLVLILYISCRNSRATLMKLHVMNWAIRNNQGRELFLQLCAGEIGPDNIIVRFEPWLNRAVDIALAEGLIQRINGDRVELSSSGAIMAKEILKKQECFVQEKEFLHTLRKSISEAKLKNIIETVTYQ